MRLKLLDTVVLKKDLPRFGLEKGDLGTIVEVYRRNGLEVEFCTVTGRTKAVVTLSTRDVRPVNDGDLFAVRRLRQRT